MTSLTTKIRGKIIRMRPYANVRGAVFFAQRLARRAPARRRLARFVARFLPAPMCPAETLTPEAAALHSEGFAMVRGVVTPAMVEQMRAYLSQQLVYPAYFLNPPLVSIDAPQLPDSHTLIIPEKAVVSCPHLLDVANHPTILATMEGIFGCRPTIGYISAWWSVPTRDGKPRHAENFHRDLDDVNFIKLFLYLTDVGPENGPHEFIRGSHDMLPISDGKRHTDAEVLSAFGADRLTTFAGPAGTMFLENTFGLHRGLPVRSGRRLILQIVYSMLPMAYGPAAPYEADRFAPARVAVDPYVNRVYVGQA